MDVLQPTRTKPIPCRMLRTKTAYGFYEGDQPIPWETGESETAVYWCLCTMQSAGPDDDMVHPDVCMHGRTCYQARDV